VTLVHQQCCVHRPRCQSWHYCPCLWTRSVAGHNNKQWSLQVDSVPGRHSSTHCSDTILDSILSSRGLSPSLSRPCVPNSPDLNLADYTIWGPCRSKSTMAGRLMRGLAMLPRGNQEALVVKDKVGRAQVSLEWSDPWNVITFPLRALSQLVGDLACKNTGCYFVGGDDLTGTLHVL